jgi:ATP-dependent Lhr-like helicase
MIDLFHPVIGTWFSARFPEPTPAQRRAWPAIREKRHTLVAAPTGSGKTLAAFLAALDDLVRQGIEGRLGDETQVVYVSPLKALSSDIQKNLQEPLAGIEAGLAAAGLPEVPIRVLVRTGDTPAAERARMAKKPPHIIVTTPESLYILLTSESGRAMLATTRTVIVDEIHAMVADKRGSHLSLSLERLAALTGDGLVRVGLSATQKPIEEVARFLVGAGGHRPRRRAAVHDRRRRARPEPGPRDRGARLAPQRGDVERDLGARSTTVSRSSSAPTGRRSCSSTPGGSPSEPRGT